MNMEIKEIFNILPAKSVCSMWLFKTVTPKFYFNSSFHSFQTRPWDSFLTLQVLLLFFLSHLEEIYTQQLNMSWALPGEQPLG